MKNLILEFKKYSFLFDELVKRDFKKKYKRTVVGVVWSVLSPVLMLLVMKLVFTEFFGRTTPHYTTYLFCGNIVFSYFSESSSQGMGSLIGNSNIFTKVNVPKYLFLLSKNVQTLINFMLTLVVFFIFCIFDEITFTWKFVLLLYPILMLLIFNIGVGLVLSALYIMFKDVEYLWGVMLRIITYFSAIFYTIDVFPQAIQRLFLCNPIYVYIHYFRNIILLNKIPSPKFHLLCAIYAFVALLLGCIIYKKKNSEFIFYV